MTVLMRVTEVSGRPVVTVRGDDVAQVRDVVYGGGNGEVAGFTLAGRGLLAGPLKHGLPWVGVRALGRDAVIIDDESVFQPRDEVIARAQAKGGDVFGSQVLTDDGVELGEVVDVVLDVDEYADVVGYEIDPTEALSKDNKRVLIPLPDTLAVSGERLIVPAAAVDFVTDDLAGFGAAVEAFRDRLRESGSQA